MKHLLSFSFFTFFLLNILSGQEIVPQLTYDQVKDDDLKLKEWRSDSSVSAFVLGNVGHISMQLVDDYYGFHFKEIRRLKILKKEGFSYASIEIPYYSKDETQKIVGIKGQTIAPNGERYPLDTKIINYQKLASGWSAAKFTFPELTEGCIVEYEYEIHSTRSLELHDWYFQDKIPTRFSVLNLNILARYEYLHVIQGKANLNVTTSRSDSSGSNRIITTYYAKDLPGLRDEQYVSHINNHLTHVRFQLAHYTGINGVKHELISNWNKIAADLWESDNFGQKFLKKTNYQQIAAVAKNVVKSTDAVKVKAQKLYDFVNKNIKWDKNYHLLSSNTPNDVWDKRRGGSADINLTLLALLKDAGMEAYPVLISTQSQGKTMPEYPVIDQFNHALIFLETGDGQGMIIDAGDASRPLGLTSQEASNGKGWLLKKEDPSWVDIKPILNSQIIVGKFDIMDVGHLNGTILTTFRNQLSSTERDTYEGSSTQPEKNRIEYLKEKNPNWQIEEIVSTTFEKKQEPLKETIACTVLNMAKTDKSLMYVAPLLKTNWDVNPFKLVNRAYPVEFLSLLMDQYVATLTIPSGYKVEEIPKDLSLTLPNDAAFFNYQIINENDKFIKLAVKLQINKTTFLPAEYNELKGFFRQIAFKFGQKVVLKKQDQ